MFLLEPTRTAWDVNFYVGPIHVRVHPLFWLISALFSYHEGAGASDLLIGVSVFFVSILIHELGHAVTMLYFGESARIVLYGMGGFATNASESIWDSGSRRQRPRMPLEQIIISFAGPAAGFLLAGAVMLLVNQAGGHASFVLVNYLPIPVVNLFNTPLESPYLYQIIFLTLYINIFWGLVNLLPVYPLDGGQISRELFVVNDPYNGLVNSLWLSVIVGGAMAIYGLSNGSMWTAMLFGSLAYGSYTQLQQMGGTRRW